MLFAPGMQWTVFNVAFHVEKKKAGKDDERPSFLTIQSHVPEKQAKFLLKFYFALCLRFSWVAAVTLDILSWCQEKHSDANIFWDEHVNGAW